MGGRLTVIKIAFILISLLSCPVYADEGYTDNQALNIIAEAITGRSEFYGATTDEYWDSLYNTRPLARLIKVLSWITGLLIALCIILSMKW